MYQLRIDKSAPFPVHTQLEEQLKVQIESGYWKPGAQLPVVRELAALLGINYNTVRAVYQELEHEGYVVTEQGRGTFVTQTPPQLGTSDRETLLDLVDDSLMRARASGIPLGVFARTTYIRAKLYAPAPQSMPLLFVECNHSDLDYFARSIERDSGLQPERHLLDDLRKCEPAFFAQFDPIVTTLSHALELQEIVGPQRRVLGLNIEPSYTDVLIEIDRLPKDTSVGFICATQQNAEQMKHAVLGAGVTHVRPVTGGINRREEVEAVFEAAKCVYVSRHGLSLHEGAWPRGQTVHEYITDFDPMALRLLRSHITSDRAARTDQGGGS